jgi:outer membrane lipoprotein carrier protein
VVFIERPNKISFRYDAPNKNRIVSDGTTLKVYIAEDNQMIEKPVEKSQYPGAFGFLMGNGISSSFTFTINEKATYKDGPVLQGKPTAPTPDYEAATFFINKEKLDRSDPGAVARVSLVDAQGNKNRFDLDGASQPATIDPSEFTFTAPPGTNIIH